MWRGRVTDRADRPVRRHPFAGSTDKGGGQPDQVGIATHGGGLHGCDLVQAETLAEQIKAARERGIAKCPALFPREWRGNRRGERFFRTGDRGLGLGKRCRQGPHAGTTAA